MAKDFSDALEYTVKMMFLTIVVPLAVGAAVAVWFLSQRQLMYAGLSLLGGIAFVVIEYKILAWKNER